MTSNNLCTHCENYQKADGGDEVGVVFERCSAFKQNFRHPVKRCTDYEDTGANIIFGRSAWGFHRSPKGEWKGFHPNTDWKVINAWTEDGDVAVADPPRRRWW
ncbi:MAG: hypothetical protein GY906_24460, partial [bacterium]|nr:hypothetical protein [bacterium]